MEVIIQYTKADYVKFFRIAYFQKIFNPSGIFLSIFLLICLYNMTISLFTQGFVLWQIILIDIIVFLAILGLLYFFWGVIYNIKLNKILLKQPPMLGKKIISLSENEIRIETASEVLILKYGDINFVMKKNHLIYFKTFDNKIELIPTRFFKSKIEAQVFFKKLQAKISKN